MALLAICALAVGIGSATAIHTVIQAVLLNRLPYTIPTAIFLCGAARKKAGLDFSLSYLDSLDPNRIIFQSALAAH